MWFEIPLTNVSGTRLTVKWYWKHMFPKNQRRGIAMNGICIYKGDHGSNWKQTLKYNNFHRMQTAELEICLWSSYEKID